MQSLKYFRGSFALMAVAYLALFVYTNNTADLLSALTLTVVEIAVSFDNAIVNADRLSTMDAFWKRMFLTVGMLVAVGLMRFVFPIVITAVAGEISFSEALHLAFHDQIKFSATLQSAKHQVEGFGGAFLGMLFLEFFVNDEKETHWIPVLEPVLALLGKFITGVHTVIIIAAVWLVSRTMVEPAAAMYFWAGLIGVGTYFSVNLLKEIIEHLGTTGSSIGKFLAGGLGTFIYLEVLDASFSFDGVIAAFAISKSLPVVMVGLGVGAGFVRSMTIMLDESGHLTEYRYLVHGAHWAIGGLSFFMLAGPVVHFSEWTIASASAIAIASAFLHSAIANRRDAKNQLTIPA